MAYTRTTNLEQLTDHPKNHIQQTTHTKWTQHTFTNEVTTTAQAFSALLAAQTPEQTVMQCRTHLEITNPNAAGTIYVGRSSAVSATNYQYILDPGGGYVKIPAGPGHDVYIIGSTTLAMVVTEVG